jgi:hypothetical protein
MMEGGGGSSRLNDKLMTISMVLFLVGICLTIGAAIAWYIADNWLTPRREEHSASDLKRKAEPLEIKWD